MEPQNFYPLLVEIIQKLRRRLFLLALLLVATTAVGYFAADVVMVRIFGLVRQVIFISPTEAFVTKIKVSLTLGLILALPFILYFIFGWVGQRSHLYETKGQCVLTFISMALFLLGGTFCFYAVLPVGIDFLLGFATLEMQPLLSAGRLVSFVSMFVLMFGLTFELPLVILMLAQLGLINADTLRAKRRYAILIIFIVAGILTPTPDVLSQTLMAVPLLILYEIGIFLTRFCRKPEPEKLEMPKDQQQLYM